ncbi:MAG TPA: SpvB/TcaC N-terminal domain-containing protein, partial [Acidimicrobiales bacterium]|nr:SpvB/TcaC N-terminal domain-containing protein [Acidimicrobiales bacterium]
MAVVACLLLVVEPLPAVARVFGGTVDDVLTRPPLLSPTQPETDALRGLQYGNPAEGISLADIPRPDHLGEAQFGYPVDIPPGRLDWHPDVSLQYGSRIANGWLGVGWDLPTPFIAVDTRWGVPRYRPDRESETYLFEGEQLSPTAHRPDQLPREAERVFTKRVEGTYHLIRRHGDRPDTYWWEVHDKLGNKYFYGRTPEPAAEIGVPEAILRDDRGNAYWWGLVEKRDISNNTVTYFYDRVEDTGVGGGQQEGAPKGAEMYLSRINYTGSVDFDDDDDGELPRFGPYNVVFTRDAQIQPYTRRPDVTIDARTGALRVTSQLLRRISVTYTENGTAQDVRSYELGYERGPFDKTLLRSVGQADATGHVFATHTFEYHNDVQRNGDYDGFDETRQWAVGDGSDDVGEELGGVGPTALGSTTSSSGDGRVYLGFNPINPDKGLSIGGGLALDGSDGESEIELIDINGDNLPDKVWKDGGVRYRLNETRPGEAPSFGPSRSLPSLPGLPEDSSFGVSVGPEAYFTVGDIMFHHGWQFNTGTSYFSDVNSDGMVDFVDGGTVYFNHLENGAPVFESHSGNTAIPISDEGISPAIGPDDDHLEEAAKTSFPLQDTLRRWVAPWTGSVTVEGPITLRGESLDGVRVAIQHNGTELWRDTIPRGSTAPLMPSLQLNVQKGDRIYFRLMSVHDGAGDNVDWDPVVTYANDEEVPRLDVNGKDVHRYVASQDFTLGGRTGIVTSMPYDGRVRVEGKVRKLRATTDDVAVVAEINGTPVGGPQVIPAAAAGDFPVALEFNVAGQLTSPSPCINDSPCVDQLG